MMIILELFATFFKIGLFTFGGGYGMIPLVQQEVLLHGWMEADELYRFIGVCESTPGPIAVNMATFVGSSQAGIAGAACATLGVVLPALIIMLLISAVLSGFRENRLVRAAMAGIRPVVAGMITATGVFIGLRCLISGLGKQAVLHPDLSQLAIAAILCAAAAIWTRVLRKGFSPILLIVFSAFCGIALYGL